MGVETLLIASLVVAAGSAAYSGYNQNEAANKARKASSIKEAMESARLLQQAQQEKARILEQSEFIKSKQTAALAGAGVDLNAGDLAKLTLDHTDLLTNRDLATLDMNVRNRQQDISLGAQSLRDAQQGTGNIIGSGLLNFSSQALNIAGSAASQNLLTSQYNTGTSAYYTSQSSQPYSLLGGVTPLRY